MEIVSKGFGEENYSIQFPLSLSPKAKLSIPGNKSDTYKIILGNKETIITIKNQHCVFKATNFKTKQSAQKFIMKLSVSLRLISLRKKLGIRFKHEAKQLHSSQFNMPKDWIEAVKANWESEDEVYKIDGLIDKFSTFIIPEHKKILDVGARSLTPVSIFEPSQIADCFCEINNKIDTQKVFKNKQLELAFQTYSSAYYHHLPQLSFISLVTCLEILSNTQKSDELSIEIINETIQFIKTKYKDKDKYSHISNILLSKIGNLKNESISDSVCRLIFKHYQNKTTDLIELSNKNECIKTVKKIYNVRSKLVHTGDFRDEKRTQPYQQFYDYYQKLEEITPYILTNELESQYFIAL